MTKGTMIYAIRALMAAAIGFALVGCAQFTPLYWRVSVEAASSAASASATNQSEKVQSQ